jgi:hypothetical protein
VRIRVNRVLRALAEVARQSGRPVPELRAVVANRDVVSLILTQPDARPMHPFELIEDGDEGWSWICLAETELPDAVSTDAVAPYPALVSFGQLPDGSLMLVDVEQIGLCQIVGTADQTRGVLRAMTLELATSTLTQDLAVAVTGFGQDLAEALRSHRLAHTDTSRAVRSVAAWAGQVAGQLEGQGTESIRAARTTGAHPDLHAPKIAVLSDVDAQQWETLEQLALASKRANAVALVGSRPGTAREWGWTIRIDEHGRAELPGMKLQVTLPQLDDEQWTRIVELLSIANMDARPADPQWLAALESFAPDQEVGLAELLGPPVAVQEAPEVVGDPAQHHAVQDSGSSEVPASGSEIVFTVVAAGSTPEPAADLDVLELVPNEEPVAGDEDSARPDQPAPAIAATEAEPLAMRLLKPQNDRPGSILDLLGEPVEPDYLDALALASAEVGLYQPTPPADRPQWSHLIRLLGPVVIEVADEVDGWLGTEAMTELAAYLTLNPFSTAEDIAGDVLVGPGKKSTARVQDVQLTKLRAMLGENAEGTPLLPAADDAGTYALDDASVVSDWTLLHEHVHAGQLAHALALVRGKPLDSQHPHRFRTWAAPIREEMISAIVDIAHTLVEAYLDEGVSESARQAARFGLLGVPDSELLHQDLIRALVACNRGSEADEAITAVLELCERKGIDPMPSTLKLLYELRGEGGASPTLRSAS